MSKPAKDRSAEFSPPQEWPPPRNEFIAHHVHNDGWTQERAEQVYADIVREHEEASRG